ncbi:MAG: HD domain-containing protein [Spirochaetaceae bacterium]|jgi:putative hydrolase of HD superfamily|nr:HD domain-containing protein [Spirochaetaceae bacterium]
MLTPALALKIFEGFSIERWNDLVRPFELIEMDKAAEKMIAAYIIGKFEERRGRPIDWEWAMYAVFFDLLQKIALSDIKSPVRRKIKNEFPREYRELSRWALGQYDGLLYDRELLEGFESYMLGTPGNDPVRERTNLVLRGAHKYATFRELEMISLVNEPERLQKIKAEITEELADLRDLPGLQMLLNKERPYRFLLVIEQLRFQNRWNQTPRVPKTSVLGHSFFVAALTLLLGRSQESPRCPRRRYNDFFSALFHDLPEAVTRDIISPVKQATGGLSEIIKKIEAEVVASELTPLMEDFYRDELMFFTRDEFTDRVVIDGRTVPVSPEDLDGRYNRDDCSPAGGTVIRAADHIAAFLEADRSIKHGITSTHLTEGRDNIRNSYAAARKIHGFDIRGFFAGFA